VNGNHRYARAIDDEEWLAIREWHRQVRLNAWNVWQSAYEARAQSRAVVAQCVEDRLKRESRQALAAEPA
jgi:hypothetical protein